MSVETVEIPRDQWDRPLIIPLSGGEPVSYTRPSTLSKILDDPRNLMQWDSRKTAEGLLRRPDLLTRLAGVLANGSPEDDWKVKRAVNKICKEAKEAAGASSGASTGTGLHGLIQAIESGRQPEFVPDHDRPRLEAYVAAMAPYTVLDVETFVVNDMIRAAGTFDQLVGCPDEFVRLGDVKTGKWDADYPLATTIQLAIYARGRRYNPATGERLPLAERLDVNTGLLIHLPATGGCRVIPLNLELGWRAAQIAAQVHGDVRKWGAADLIRNTP